MSEVILDIQNLSVKFQSQSGVVHVLKDVSLQIRDGEMVGLVGESGSGKSVTSLCVMDLLASNAIIESGKILYRGQDLLKLSESEKRKIRGKKISMIFQDPMTSLNPCFRIQEQLEESLKEHTELNKQEREQTCIKLLEQVGISDAKNRLRAYPHELSGGLAQRIMIAMAISCQPDILIADEPTTALDVTIQSQILSLIRSLQREKKLSVLFISHDLGVIAQNCSWVYVMYAGQVVESASVKDLITSPKHPYTKALLNCLPAKNANSVLLPSIAGVVPNLANRPSGCQFHERCSAVFEKCKLQEPLLISKIKFVQNSTDRFGSSRCWIEN